MKRKSPEALVALAESHGWHAKAIKNGWMLYPPDKAQQPVTLHRNSRDPHWFQNAVHRLRKSGLDVK